MIIAWSHSWIVMFTIYNNFIMNPFILNYFNCFGDLKKILFLFSYEKSLLGQVHSKLQAPKQSLHSRKKIKSELEGRDDHLQWKTRQSTFLLERGLGTSVDKHTSSLARRKEKPTKACISIIITSLAVCEIHFLCV